MKAKTIFLMVFVALLLTVSFSFALAEEFVVLPSTNSVDFQLIAPQQFSVCSCGNEVIPITIVNSGSFTTAYAIQSSDAAVQPATTLVQLKPGQQAVIGAAINVACVDYGPQNSITFTVTSSFSQSKSVQVTPEVTNCFATEFSLIKAELNASACSPVNSTLYIANNGLVEQEYVVSASPTPYTLSAGSVIIPAKSTAAIDAAFTFACGLTGTRTVEYKVTALAQDETFVVRQPVTFIDDYSFTLESSVDQMQLCGNTQNELYYLLTNTGSATNRFTIKTILPEFTTLVYPEDVRLVENTVELAAGESYEFILRVDATGYKQTMAQATITITGEYGSQQVQVATPIVITNCFDAEIVSYRDGNQFVCEHDELVKELTIISTGSQDMLVSVRADTDSIRITEDDVLLPAGEVVTVPITFIPVGVGQEFATITVSYNDSILDQRPLRITSYSNELCYELAVALGSQQVHYQETEYVLRVENEGTRYGDFLVELQTEHDLVLLEDTLSLAVGQESTVSMVILESILPGDYLNATLVFTNEQSGVVFTKYVSLEVTDDPLWKRFADAIILFFKTTALCVLISLALLLFMVIVLLVLLFKPYKKRQWTWRWGLLLVLLIVGVVAFFIVYHVAGSFPQLYTEHNVEYISNVHLLLNEDTPRLFNLQDFFYDPDGNIEVYGVSEYDEDVITYTLSQSQLTLYPAKDFEGETLIKLFAVDTQGLVAESQMIKVEVLGVEDYTLKELYDLTCMYANLILFWICLLLIFLAGSFTKKKQTEKQTTLTQTKSLSVVKKQEPVASKTVDADLVQKVPSKKTSAAKQSTRKPSSKKPASSSTDTSSK